MLKKRTIAALVLIFYLFTLAAPAASVAADAGAVAAAAAALTGHGLGGAADAPETQPPPKELRIAGYLTAIQARKPPQLPKRQISPPQ